MCARSRTAKPDLRAIGKRIRGLRGNIRQQELAAELGISQGQLSKVERGGVAPALEVLLQLGLKFEKSIDWIVTGEGK
jgi:transcriptional regulator with XRE-family HTH domain